MGSRTSSAKQRVVTIMATCVTAAALAAPALSQPTIEARAVVSYGPLNAAIHEVSAAAWQSKTIDPKVVAMWMTEITPSRLDYAVSTDGARRWRSKTLALPPETSSVFDPSVAVGPDGTFVSVFFLGIGQTENSSVYFARMAPGTTDFSAASLIEPEQNFDFPKVVAAAGQGGQSNFYVLCNDTGNPPVLHASRSLNSGVSWDNIQPIQPDGKVFDLPGKGAAPAVSADGTLYVAYLHTESQQDLRHRLIKSVDQAENFTRVDDQTGFLNEQHELDNYDTYVPGAFRIPGFGQLAADPTDANRLYYVFINRTGELVNGDGNVDVFLMRSTDAGETWAARQLINQDDPQQDPERYDQFMPAINVDDTGRVHIIWYDTRKDHPPADLDPPLFNMELYYAWSDDNGQTFTEQLIGHAIYTDDLTNNGFIGDYNGLTSAGGVVVPVYMGTFGSLVPFFPPDETIFSNRILHP